MVSAELALAIPALVIVVLALAWLVALGVSQGIVAQAAREGARAGARGESAATVRAAVTAVAPGAQVSIHREVSSVTVIASLERTPPVRFLRPLGREIRATATGWREDQ